MTADTVLAPVHPGEILLEEFLRPLGVRKYHLAKEIGVPARRSAEASRRLCPGPAASQEQHHAADLLRPNGLSDWDILVADTALEDVNDLVASIARWRRLARSPVILWRSSFGSGADVHAEVVI